MQIFPDNIRFKLPWRSYQKRVLSELEKYLDDKHLHIIAPPGSGKTVLGLEVMLQLNQQTLILSPTITIRNQWIERFIDLFLPRRGMPDWISTDVRNPEFLTVITYQALYSLYSVYLKQELEKGVYNGFKPYLLNAGFKTIVVDEAHHLRSEWWKSLMMLKENIPDSTIVALTATPPYDVSSFEWKRYQEFCGPVDSEIYVPELIQEKNLCPHQDYIYFSIPLREEYDRIRNFRESVDIFIEGIKTDGKFISALKGHPWILDPYSFMENILSYTAYFSSIALFLHSIGEEVPKSLLKVIGVSKKKMPKLDNEWFEYLLTGFLYSDDENYSRNEELVKDMRNQLSKIGAVARGKIVLMNTKEIDRILTTSISKLESILKVVRHENESIGSELRILILTDYIRSSEMPKKNSAIKPLTQMGVVPIFEKIRRENITNIAIGVLSGSLVILPETARNTLKQLSSRYNIIQNDLKIEELEHDNHYFKLEVKNKNKQNIVAIVTELFSRGKITVLIGTISLLGEGWDAPIINSLILATFVGSYMLSNQIRGRAIRYIADNPNKTANIWHLVCIEPRSRDGGSDMKLLTRRFKAFLGVSFMNDIIQNGILRMNIPAPPYSESAVKCINYKMLGIAGDRQSMKGRWDAALQDENRNYNIVDEVKVSCVSLPRGFVFENTIRAVFWEGAAWGGYFLSEVIESAVEAALLGDSIRSFFLYVGYLFVFLAVLAIPKLAKALWLLLRHGRIESSMEQVGLALVKALQKIGAIRTKLRKLRVKTRKGKNGKVFCNLYGSTTYEKSLFLNAFQDILDPVENPRYLIVRKSRLFRLAQKNYHAVPQILGRKEEFALYFANLWRKHVGAVELIYTRTAEGRNKLLKARMHSLSSSFLEKSERISSWK